MSVVELSPIVKTIEVRRTADDAFRIFTQETSAWWPLKSHSRARTADGEVALRVEIETRIGGRIYETLNTGEHRDWGEVLAYEPGKRFLFTFELGRAKEKSGEVEVTFEPLGAGTCRVTLTHAHWERYDDAEIMRGRFAKGWEEVFCEGFGGYVGLA
ncbi:MAG: SRPBCC domain-containing protein [Hyphomonadaceae bacterium]|nr:SRPBCC domain-containing protein [Hyphomonadaceae bacterium]